MSDHTALALDLTFSSCCWIGGTCFVVWIGWSALRGLANYLFIRSLRIDNREINAHRVTPDFRVGGDCK
jgi:hypothetical protein